MLSKWQLMAQARQKREGGPEIASSSQSGKDTTSKQVANTVGNAKEIQGTGKKDSSAALPASGNSVVSYCLIKKLIICLSIKSSPTQLHAQPVFYNFRRSKTKWQKSSCRAASQDSSSYLCKGCHFCSGKRTSDGKVHNDLQTLQQTACRSCC